MILSTDACLVLVGALLLDALIGDPDVLWRRWPHPVTWLGAIVAFADRHLNPPESLAETADSLPPHAEEVGSRSGAGDQVRRVSGVIFVAVYVPGALAAGWLLETGLRALPGGPLLLAAAASVLLAFRSLRDHIRRVSDAFRSGGLAGARRAVSMIVGRDPERLDEGGVARAAIESAAENFSDGVVAPAFWFAFGGLPGLLAYKAINTADSMIGHLSDRHRHFGWAAARLDDLVNLAPARLSGGFVALAAPLAGGKVGAALRIMRRDAGLHRSPNAGWPEGAMAGALGIALATPRSPASGPVHDPFLNPEGGPASPADIGRALRVLDGAALLHAGLYGLLALGWLLS